MASECMLIASLITQENEKVGAKAAKEKHEGMRMASECMLIASLIR